MLWKVGYTFPCAMGVRMMKRKLEMMKLASVMMARTKTRQSVPGTFLGVFEPHRRPGKGTDYSALFMSYIYKEITWEKHEMNSIMV